MHMSVSGANSEVIGRRFEVCSTPNTGHGRIP